MGTITLNDLKQQSAERWLEDKGDLIVTSQGQPVAVLIPVNGKSMESTLAAVRSLRAIQALASLQESARVNGTSGLSLDEIDAEIDSARKAR